MLGSTTLVFLFAIIMNPVYADEILTTVSEATDKIIFDGKWTFTREWKSSSENVITYDNGYKLSVKTAHDYDNLYVLIDFISDRSIQKFGDRGIVCIDGNMNRGKLPGNDDYCFSVVVGSKNAITLQGNSLTNNLSWKRIENHSHLVAVGGISDENDRYSAKPHSTYELKIPLEVVGRSDKYGFYVLAYDANSGISYSWPQYTAKEENPFIPSPDTWGDLISPDKSIPEFEMPYVLLIVILIPAILARLVFQKNITN